MVRRLFQCLALSGAAIGSSALGAYTVALQSSNDCRHDGSVVVNLVVTSTDGPSLASGGQFFLNYDSGLSVTSMAADPSVLAVSLTFNNGAHEANIAVGAPFANPSAVFSVGQTLATITFAAGGTYCHQSGLVGFRSNVPATTLTDSHGNPLAVGTVGLGSISLNDTTLPVITPPGNLTVSWADGKDPWATGYATATDNCDPSPVITYVDDRTGLTSCGAVGGRGVLTRTWKATDHCGNFATAVQTITVTDTTPPVQTGCPYNITQNAPAGGCSAVISYATPTAYDQQHFEGFENPAYQAGGPEITSPFNDSQSTDWNTANSLVHRVPSGTDGITSKTGAAHARIDSASLPAAPDNYSGAYTRLGGYGSAFGNGFISSQDVYINLADPAVAASTYGFDLDTAASNSSGGFLRDFIFHTAGQPGSVLVGADNNSNFARRNDLGTINHYTITTSGWYTFEWNFRNNGGVLAVDMNLRDASGKLLWTEVRSDPSDTIPAVVGGNRYMWFTFIAADTLHIDNTSLIRPLPVGCSRPSTDTYVGTTTVTCSSIDACLNTTNCSFDVTVNSSNTLVATLEETGLSSPSIRCITLEAWRSPACAPVATTTANVAFNSTNTVDFSSFALGALPGANTPSDTRTPGGSAWWLPSNCATSARVAAGVGRFGGNGLIVGNNGSGNDGVIDNLKTPRLPYAAGETASPVNSASSRFRSSYWFRTATSVPADGFAFKSESYGPDRTTYFGTWYQTASGDTSLNSGVYAIEEIGGGAFDFVFHPVAVNMTWGAWYRVETTVTFVNGSNNDIVDYRLFDSANTLIGSALGLRDWEEGARQFGYNGGSVFGIDAVQFQARGDYSGPGAHDVAFVDGITYSALPTVLVDIPCGTPYTAVTATDTRHTLRRTGTGAPNFGISGTNYFADFTAASGKALEQGNANNDPYIDILDFGIFIGQYSTAPGGSTPCGYVGNHADFSGNGIVGTEDFTFIQAGFLHFRDLDPCGASLQDGGPITDVSVSDLVASGNRQIAMADFNLDGRLNAADIAWVAAHGLPRCIADFNDDQSTSVQDIFDFLSAWFADHPKADLNANNHADVQDIFQFLDVWFQGC